METKGGWWGGGSIALRPHSPRRLGEAASINLLSISRRPIEHSYECRTAPPPLSVWTQSLVSQLLNLAHRRFSDGTLYSVVAVY